MSKASTRAVAIHAIVLLLGASLVRTQAIASPAGTGSLAARRNASGPLPAKGRARADVAHRTTTTTAPLQDENWYVIVGSYPKAQRRRANARARYFQRKGYAAFVLDTDKTDALTHGLFAVVIGPYSRSKAQQVLNGVRSFDGNAYIKAFFGMS